MKPGSAPSIGPPGTRLPEHPTREPMRGDKAPATQLTGDRHLPGRSRERRPSTMPVLLATIVAIALSLRLWGIAWQLPWEFHPDEGHYVWKAVQMVQDGNLNPKYFRNPSLYTYLLYSQFKLLDLLALSFEALPASWEALRPPSVYVLLGRLTTAVLGAMTVAVTYRLGAELLGRGVGVLGALLLATCFLHVRDSHFATNDVPATFLLTLSVLFSARLATGIPSKTAPNLLVAAVFGGLATSTKYNAGFFLAPLVLAYVVAHRRQAMSPRRVAELLGALFLSLLAYLAATPFSLLAWPAFREDFLVQQRFAREGWEGQGPEPVGWLYFDTLGQGLGWVTLALAMIGFVVLARRRSSAVLLLGAYPVAYLGYMLSVKLFFARFAVTVTPFLCLAAAYAAVELGGALDRRLRTAGARPLRHSARAMVVGTLTFAAVAEPLWKDFQHQRILARPDTRVQAFAWLEANLPQGARIIADEYTVRDRRPRPALADRGRFDVDVVNALSERALEFYLQQGYHYAVVSSFQYQRFPGSFNTYDELERRARSLASFAPTADGQDLPFDIEELYSPFHNLALHERPGPTVRVYALPVAQ
jgi:4-amino-4-deoxy-L-arabinose transferase-like glycosyltransferase